jgi:hypothetical protein
VTIFLIYKFVTGFAMASFAGIMIAGGFANRERQYTARFFGHRALICFLLSGLMRLFSLGAHSMSKANGESMMTTMEMDLHSVAFLAASIGFAVTGAGAVVVMLTMLMNRRLKKSTEVDSNLPEELE